MVKSVITASLQESLMSSCPASISFIFYNSLSLGHIYCSRINKTWMFLQCVPSNTAFLSVFSYVGLVVTHAHTHPYRWPVWHFFLDPSGVHKILLNYVSYICIHYWDFLFIGLYLVWVLGFVFWFFLKTILWLDQLPTAVFPLVGSSGFFLFNALDIVNYSPAPVYSTIPHLILFPLFPWKILFWNF